MPRDGKVSACNMKAQIRIEGLKGPGRADWCERWNGKREAGCIDCYRGGWGVQTRRRGDFILCCLFLFENKLRLHRLQKFTCPFLTKAIADNTRNKFLPALKPNIDETMFGPVNFSEESINFSKKSINFSRKSTSFERTRRSEFKFKCILTQ